MRNSPKSHAKSIALSFFILGAAFGISFLLQDTLDISEHITTLFVFAVFIISLLTDGFLYGIIASIISAALINYAFTYPYFNVDFTVPESIFSAIVMLVISFLTGTLTTRLKHWQALKAESEHERMRANLLRAVSHDLRTPLTTIYGASSSVIENYDKFSDKQKMQMAIGIKEDAEWLIRMVENLLSITKIDDGRVKLLKTPTVLDELIDSVLLKFKKRYPEVKMSPSLPDALVLIPIDAILVEQVIFNILENAVQHANGMTQLSLSVSLSDGGAIFQIADDGCGIDKDRLDTLFTLGYASSSAATDTQKRNFGIGLSVCATIVKAHGGSITAENVKNGGAVFSFSIPVEEESQSGK